MCFIQDRQAHAEGAVRCLTACDGLKHEVHRPAPVHDVEHGRDMREHAGLGGNAEAHPQVIDQPEQQHRLLGAVGRRVDPDHRVATAVHEAVEDRGADAFRIIGGVVGLKPDGEAARQSEGVAEPGDDSDLPGHCDQVLVAHQLRDSGHHFGRQPRCKFLERLRGRRIRKKPVSERANGHRRNGRKRCSVMAVEDQARDLVCVIGHDWFVKEAA